MSGTSSPQQRAKLAEEYRAEKRDPARTPSITFGNASPCRPSYTGNHMGTPRDGANDFQLINSVNFGAQIRRATS